MKYRRLAPEELQELGKEFVNFLASAQITAQDWEMMKKKEMSKAEELIDVFSDLVYEKVLKKIKYLDFREAKSVNLFHCLDDRIELIGLRLNEGSTLDLTDPAMLAQWSSDNNASVQIIRTEKKYAKERNLEVLEMLESGCLISDGKLFQTLKDLK